uniref:Putative ovule protein n=1 Tax=Solanum chacoense TaxID=4108 RepID=A0A0V0H1M3_SOLCH
MQVAVSKTPVGSLVIGVDIVPIKPICGAIAVQEDITTAKCKSTIKRIIAEKGCSGFDLILHDGSPNMGGAWAMEATVQSSLVIDSVKLATQFLLPNGTFVTKVRV